jgi:hypothetical protein
MPRTIAFDTFAISWLTFRLPTGANQPDLEAFATLVNGQNDGLPRAYAGWSGLSSGARSALNAALLTILFELGAAELALVSGEGLMLDPGGRVRKALNGETPRWVKP